ncbi:MerR family DNA-binding transcriptional regulator [Pseudomonadota bacterium]
MPGYLLCSAGLKKYWRVAAMHTIGEVSKRFSISRSTLLYYDAIGLLSPSGRSNANYRSIQKTI